MAAVAGQGVDHQRTGIGRRDKVQHQREDRHALQEFSHFVVLADDVVPTGFLVVVGEQTLRGQTRVGFPGFDPERAGLGGTDGLIQLPNVTRQETPRLDL